MSTTPTELSDLLIGPHSLAVIHQRDINKSSKGTTHSSHTTVHPKFCASFHNSSCRHPPDARCNKTAEQLQVGAPTQQSAEHAEAHSSNYSQTTQLLTPHADPNSLSHPTTHTPHMLPTTLSILNIKHSIQIRAGSTLHELQTIASQITQHPPTHHIFVRTQTCLDNEFVVTCLNHTAVSNVFPTFVPPIFSPTQLSSSTDTTSWIPPALDRWTTTQASCANWSHSLVP